MAEIHGILPRVHAAEQPAPASFQPVSTAMPSLLIADDHPLVRAAFHTMRLAMPGLAARGYGRVVNIASVHGLVASTNKAPYVASKFGIVGLSKVAALEYAAQGNRDSGGVTVNCICPGWVETPLIEPQIEARMQAGSRDDGVRALLAEKQPSLRMTLPAEIAALAVFLCRREAHNITGTAMPVDGGWTAQ